MAKKNKNIPPKDGANDRPKKSGQEKIVPKSKKIAKKLPLKGKSAKKQIVKSALKNKKTGKEVAKVGGFSKNNFNYIRSLLWKNYRSDFVSYFDPSFIRLVREIFNDCKAAGVSCTEEIIKQKYENLKSDDKRTKPYILPYFLEPKVYYEIKDVPFPTLAPYLYVVSPMILPYPHEFRITEYFKKSYDSSGREQLDIRGYDKYFGEWVNWCNAVIREEHGNNAGSEDLEIAFKMTDAEYNIDKKRWETFIYICTPSGKIETFGYKPETGFDKEVEPEYRIPSAEKLSELPVEKQEKSKIKRITRKQKINDTLNSWDTFFGSIKKSSEKESREKFGKELEELKSTRLELEKMIRSAKRNKNTKAIKQLQKEFDKLTKRYLLLIKKGFK